MNILSFRLIDRPDRFTIACATNISWRIALARVYYMHAAARSGVMYKSHTSTTPSYKYLLLVSYTHILFGTKLSSSLVAWLGLDDGVRGFASEEKGVKNL